MTAQLFIDIDFEPGRVLAVDDERIVVQAITPKIADWEKSDFPKLPPILSPAEITRDLIIHNEARRKQLFRRWKREAKQDGDRIVGFLWVDSSAACVRFPRHARLPIGVLFRAYGIGRAELEKSFKQHRTMIAPLSPWVSMTKIRRAT
jgi:hypothetical protein